jgi:hypothetical protein
MQNLKVYAPLVDGGVQDFEYEDGLEMIQQMFTDDWGPPPRAIVFEATTDDGRTVKISIPYKKSNRVSVTISEDEAKSGD